MDGMVKVKCVYSNNYDECCKNRINQVRYRCCGEISGNVFCNCDTPFYIDWVKFITNKKMYVEVK